MNESLNVYDHLIFIVLPIITTRKLKPDCVKLPALQESPKSR